jgi:hypothetical protein
MFSLNGNVPSYMGELRASDQRRSRRQELLVLMLPRGVNMAGCAYHVDQLSFMQKHPWGAMFSNGSQFSPHLEVRQSRLIPN